MGIRASLGPGSLVGNRAEKIGERSEPSLAGSGEGKGATEVALDQAPFFRPISHLNSPLRSLVPGYIRAFYHLFGVFRLSRSIVLIFPSH